MKITIGEIALQSGVSKGTVSRVINSKSTVAKVTRQNVLAVMKRFGYEPDPVARELSMRTKHTLGIWVGAGENRLSPYFNLTLSDDRQWAYERANGFKAELAESKIPGIESVIVRGQGSVLGGYRLMRDAWGQGHRPTGIFCATDEMAVGALGALADLGVAVPGEVSVIGFDGMVELYPGLASVGQDIPAIAHEAVSLALAAIEKNTVRQKVVPVTLIDGATLDPAPTFP